uniref:TGc domain-containing protein n=1 Tax=Rodentolepis nana TaxID=102285 RepID=A0A158QIP8_RODNA
LLSEGENRGIFGGFVILSRIMSCPVEFRLELNPELETHPLPKPPEYLKHQVYEKAEVFEKIDNHAIEISKRDFPTFTHLMWNLVFRHKMSDIERARVIFRWITSKNMQRISFDSAPPNSPEELLLSFKDNKTSFARIYEIMCTYAGLHCVAISGYAKGVDYFPGDRFQGLPPNHSWNAVYLKGSWQLVDAHWATRYLSSGMNMHDNVVYEYDDFYFLMEPQQAVYSHFPEDCRWQLLTKQLTLAQFESLPLTKSQFFKCAMDFRGEHHGVVQVLDGCIRMTLGFWRPGAFTYKLQHLVGSARSAQPALLPVRSSDLTNSFEMTIPGIAGGQEQLPLKDFVLQETTDDALNFFIRLPARGAFFLTIYAQDLSNVVMAKNGTFRAACEYKLVFAEGEACCEPYPACDGMNWGPSWLHARHYGLEMPHPSGVISLPPGRVTPTGEHVESGHLELRCTRHRPDVQLFTKLKKNYVPDEVLEQFQRIHLSDGEAIFELNLPEPGKMIFIDLKLLLRETMKAKAFGRGLNQLAQNPLESFKQFGVVGGKTRSHVLQTVVLISSARHGEYGFDIYANEPDDGRAFTHICQYLVHYEAPQGWRPQHAENAWETKTPEGIKSAHPGASRVRQSMLNDTNRVLTRVLSPTQYEDNADNRDQFEFRYAPTTWSDTESLDRGMSSMRINGDDDDSVFTMQENPKVLDEGKISQYARDVDEGGFSRTENDANDGEDYSIGRITGRRMNVTEQVKRSQPYIMALLEGKSATVRPAQGSLSQASATNGKSAFDSERNDRYSPFSGDNHRPSQQYNRIGVTNQPVMAGKTFPSSATSIPPPSYATWVPGPLQKEPPKEFVPQLLEPEPAYQKPAPDAFPDRTPAYAMQEDDAFKVSNF